MCLNRLDSLQQITNTNQTQETHRAKLDNRIDQVHENDDFFTEIDSMDQMIREESIDIDFIIKNNNHEMRQKSQHLPRGLNNLMKQISNVNSASGSDENGRLYTEIVGNTLNYQLRSQIKSLILKKDQTYIEELQVLSMFAQTRYNSNENDSKIDQSQILETIQEDSNPINEESPILKMIEKS